ncbi:MAG TPA: hypothetical protein VJ726_11805 [Candidatus Limnocylindria bacterium]|nr:hypothetical protein [Candidatus Limnocylindria bacterium]
MRARVSAQRAHLERLGAAFDEGPEELIEWGSEWGIPLAPFVPLSPSLLRAGLALLDERERELDTSLSALAPSEWERRDGPDGWSLRMVVDHLAAGSLLFLLRVEIWPLDPDEAQRGALQEVVARAARFGRESTTFAHFGWNGENGRVRWTARKVARAVRRMQDAYLAYIAGGPEPMELDFTRHEDADGDDGPAADQELSELHERDEELRRAAHQYPHVRVIAFWYRYYRDRLTLWPSEELERWRAMRAAFRGRLLSYDESELAAIRVAPHGGATSVRQQLALALSHVPEHSAQIAKILAAAQPARG